MNKKYFGICFSLFLLTLSIQFCLTDPKIKSGDNNHNDQNSINESFHQTGWITDNKFRAVIFIITDDECKNSSLKEIEEKIKFEAYKQLQKELSPGFNKNASIQIKNLIDNSGKMIKPEKGCISSNMYFYDLEKKDLKSDFERIKNLK